LGIPALIALIVAAAMSSGSAHAVDIAAAEKQFLTSCGVCHTAGAGQPHRQGPNLFGIFGRSAGSRADFEYSEALRTGGWTWTQATLDPWLENAQAARPGTTMSYRQRDPEKRALIIEFLKSLSTEGADYGTRDRQG
jgi:cytochrome c